MNNVKAPNVVPNVKAPPSEFMENLKMGLFITVFLLFIGLILFGIYKALKAVGIKPASKNSKEQCGLDIECKSNMCRFGMCL